MKNSLLLYGFVFCCTLVLGQENNFQIWSLNTPLSVSSENQQEVDAPVYINDWKEVIEERTLSSAVFKNSKGDVRAEYANRPIHYYRDGHLERIDPSLKETADGYISENQPFPTFLEFDGSFSLSLDKDERFNLGKNCALDAQNGMSEFQFQNNIAYFQDFFTGIDKQIAFSENKIKYGYRINAPVSEEDEFTVISEELYIPKGYQFSPLKNQSYEKDGLWYGSLALMNPQGIQVALIRPLVCFDNDNKHILGGYRIEKGPNQTILELCIPNSWLTDSDRAYPVIIDPEIAGTPTEWTGGNMPSCMLPNYNSDSILVNIPAGVSITGFFITASFYANPFSPAVMSDGTMYFSTSCANSQYFTITGDDGDIAGTAYLDSFNLKLPLACCFPESCNDTSVYVTMHLARSNWGFGCGFNYVLYDDITDWPFRVVVYGKTPEIYGNEFYVSQSSICSNICTFNATGYARYGVAPYTFTHPWTTEVVVDGENTGCSTGATNHVFTLTIPDCPIYCDETYTSLDIPPPVITDACGQFVLDIPNNSKPIDPAANVVAVYDSVFCDGEQIEVDLTSCLDGGTAHHFGNGLSGPGSISTPAENNGPGELNLVYNTYATIGDCTSDTSQISITVVPNPVAQIHLNPNPLVVNLPVELADNSITYINPIQLWNWQQDGIALSNDSSLVAFLDTPGEYEICLNVMDTEGCLDSICETLLVVPAEIENINIITPNDDDINDELAFQYLEFYPDNEIFIFNRWGNLIYNAKSYDNSWTGEDHTEGTYFYILVINEIDKTYSSFFQLKK